MLRAVSVINDDGVFFVFFFFCLHNNVFILITHTNQCFIIIIEIRTCRHLFVIFKLFLFTEITVEYTYSCESHS